MRKTGTFLLACCLSLLATGGYAQSPVTVYSGASTPAQQGWNELKLDASVNTAAATTTQNARAGVLNFTSENAVNQFSQLGWYRNNLGFNLGKGYTIEVKAKLNAAGKGAFNIQGYDNEGKGFRLDISETQLTNQSDPLKATTVVKNGLTNDSEFHIYRLAVAPSGIATVYRDSENLGNFTVSAFQFDNIITNGGFEDEEIPDFTSNGLLIRSTNPKEVRTGARSLVMNSNGMNNGTEPREAATTRGFQIKPNMQYDFSFDIRRVILNGAWAWRDLGGYWNTQVGTFGGEPGDTPNVFWWGNPFEGRQWQAKSGDITTPNDPAINTFRFEWPSWIKDGNNTSIMAVDNLVFRERNSLVIGATEVAHGFPEPVFHEGYENLITNGGFEDHATNNDNTPYTWALSAGNDSNDPTEVNSLWNGRVRIQRNDKTDENGAPYAHSGSSSLRFCTLGNGDGNFDFSKELEPNKTYRFNFWHRVPQYDDNGGLKVRIGNTVIWGHHLWNRSNVWANADLVFTTTSTDYTLHLYTTSADHGNWWNIYFDDLVLYELTGDVDPQIAGKVNLIANGDFEDTKRDNAGKSYNWSLASAAGYGDDNNFPVRKNDQWGTFVRLQDQQKMTDTGSQWAHSGTKSLRFSFLDDWDAACNYELGREGAYEEVYPDPYRVNMDFRQELEPNKTYTFVFWVKSANYPDRGRLIVANDDIRIWDEELSAQYINWTRQSITFSTTAASHTLRMFTEFNGWFNFYLDDLFLYEEDTYVPYEANGSSYFFFGKSQNTASADVEIEYVKIDNTGAYSPDQAGEEPVPATAQKFYIDFGQGAGEFGHVTVGADARGNYWNNLTAPNGAPSTLNAGYKLSLLNSKNQPTPYLLETTQNWKSNGRANGGLLAPDPELLGDLAVATATEDYFFLDTDIGGRGAFKLKNLDPKKAYKFYVFGCRQENAVRGGVFSITGANSASGYLQNSGPGIGTNITNTNDRTIYESLPVAPDANGEILFEATIQDASYLYINAMKIEEVLDFELTEDLPVKRKFYIDLGPKRTATGGQVTASPDANGNYWNSLGYGSSGTSSQTTTSAQTISSLNTSDNTLSGYTLATSGRTRWNGGTTTANGALTTPNPELLGDFAINTATHDYLHTSGTEIATLNFTGLNTKRYYRFNLFGSRAATDNRTGIFTMTGENKVYGVQQMSGTDLGGSGINQNNSNIYVSELVTPASNGQISLTLTRSTATEVYLNIIKMEEILFHYAIRYETNGGEAIPKVLYTVESETVILPAEPVKEGCIFRGWYADSEFGDMVVTEVPQGSEGDKTFYAKWDAILYDITYETNGGEAINAGTYTAEDDALILPEPFKANYTFLGWYDNVDLNGTAITEIPKGSSGNKDFYAKWEATAYTITYETNGGTEIAEGSYTVESAVVELPATTVKTAYTFQGWYDNVDLNGTAVTQILQGSYGDTTFYAKWEATAYSVTYVTNGGEAISEGSYTIENEGVTLPATAVKTAYTFQGWYDNVGLTGTAVNQILQGSYGDTTFYAKWEAISYPITYVTNGGDAIEPGEYTIESVAVTLPASASRTGYTFLAWYDNSDLEGTTVTQIPQGSYGDTTFYAKWEAISYAITYVTNGGDAIEPDAYTIESAALTLPTPVKQGHTFEGWYDNVELNGTAVTAIPQGSYGDTTFYAKWEVESGLDMLDAALRLYPNPVVNGRLTIENIPSESGRIEVYNVLGTLTALYEIAGSKTVIDISALSAGTYIVKVSGRIAKIQKK
jgi:uncharacterized repeat protein (TIGR02543 family)